MHGDDVNRQKLRYRYTIAPFRPVLAWFRYFRQFRWFRSLNLPTDTRLFFNRCPWRHSPSWTVPENFQHLLCCFIHFTWQGKIKIIQFRIECIPNTDVFCKWYLFQCSTRKINWLWYRLLVHVLNASSLFRTSLINGQWGLMGINNVPIILMQINGD